MTTLSEHLNATKCSKTPPMPGPVGASAPPAMPVKATSVATPAGPASPSLAPRTPTMSPPPPVPSTMPKSASTQEKGPDGYLSVLVDSLPGEGYPGRHVSAENFTATSRAEIASELRIPDWSVAEFKKGRGILAAKVRTKLACLNEHIVISIRSDSELFKAIGEVLLELADDCVIGTR